ncbi:MAG: precorrin-6A reductase [Bacillota bacterium]
MILVIGGTSDGRMISAELAARGARVLVSSATPYGANLAKGSGIEVVYGRLDLDGLTELIISRGVRTLLDASHPFATEVTKNAAGACERTGARYIRYARPGGERANHPLVKWADSYEEAAEKAFETGQKVFLTTGSKTAGLFIKKAAQAGVRIILRVVPDPDAIGRLIEMGVSPSDIVAMSGPFSEELNFALLKHFSPDVVVSKESGDAGGLGDKISAAVRLGLPTIIIRRPPEPAGAAKSVREAVEMALMD